MNYILLKAKHNIIFEGVRVNKIILAVVIIANIISGMAIAAPESLTDVLEDGRESMCYKHPDKQLCLDNAMMLMRGASTAAEIKTTCEVNALVAKNDPSLCKDAKAAIDWLDSK